jgi:hypothetical protein
MKTPKTLLLGALLTASALASAQQVCDFVPLESVTKAFPATSAWRVANGGSGGCRFQGEQREGSSIRSVILSLTQRGHETADETLAFMKSMRAEFGSENDLSADAKLGAEGFFQLSKGQPLKDNLQFWSHRGRMAVSGLMLTPGGGRISEQDKSNLTSLIAAALIASDTPQAYAKAAQCPYFESALLSKILLGKVKKVQQFGNNACMAEGENDLTLQLTRLENRRGVAPSIPERWRTSGAKCSGGEITGVGEVGFAFYDCKDGGTPFADVKFLANGFRHELSLSAPQAPSAAQREDLLTLARYMAGLK